MTVKVLQQTLWICFESSFPVFCFNSTWKISLIDCYSLFKVLVTINSDTDIDRN